MIDAVDPVTVDLHRVEFQLELLAHDSSQKAAHRMLLPSRLLHHRSNRRTRCRLQHRDHLRLLGGRDFL